MQTWRQAIEGIRQIQTRKGRAAFGRFSIEGTRHLERAVRANLPLQHIIVADSFWNAPTPRIQALRTAIEQRNLPVVITPDAPLADLLGGRKLGAIVGVAPIPHAPRIADLIAERDNALFLLLVDVVEPGNVGAMIRTAHGLGTTACVTIGSSDAFHPKAVRTAMGSSFKLPIIQFETASAAIEPLKSAGCTLYASVAENGALLPTVRFAEGARAILMGGEFYGLSAEIIAQCDHLLTIPMADGIDSFSVSAAAAILLYAARPSFHAPCGMPSGTLRVSI